MGEAAVLPVVSVVVPTYQHAEFIEQCLDGILMQQTSFPIEVLVGEDESTDGTREICERYATAHPDRIRLFLRSRKDVIHIDGKPTGRANLLGLFHEAKGEFIAWCDGDDAWIDPNKLQLQVEALQADPEAAACFTNAWNEQEGERWEFLNGTIEKMPGARVGQSELLSGQAVPVCTFMCRASMLWPLPDVLRRTPTCDTVLHAHLSNFGHYLYIPAITTVRHVHPGGIYSMKSSAYKQVTMLRDLPYMDSVSHYRHHTVIEERMRTSARKLWYLSLEDRNEETARLSWRILARRRKEAGWSRSRTARNYLKAYWPRTERLIGKLWDRVHGRL